jgi:D-glycero-D-manno-heptose 1,7-bisphosphate phosphatase
MMKKPAVFIDRDGTINEEMGYINHISRFRIFPFAFEAISLLNKYGFLVIVVTNQSGAARGYTSIEFVSYVHRHMQNVFEQNNCHIDDIFVCMHRKDSVIPELRVDCNCRKPKTGLIEQALSKYPIDLAHTYVVGDRLVDIEMGKKMNIKGILVKTGYGLGEIDFCLEKAPFKPDFIEEDLLCAAKRIIQDAGSDSKA